MEGVYDLGKEKRRMEEEEEPEVEQQIQENDGIQGIGIIAPSFIISKLRPTRVYSWTLNRRKCFNHVFQLLDAMVDK